MVENRLTNSTNEDMKKETITRGYSPNKSRKLTYAKFKGGTCYKSHMKTHMRSEGIDDSEAKMKLYHYCDKCGKRFNTKFLLIGHTRSVHDKIDYTCPGCPITWKTQYQLYNHRKLAHSTDERFNCKHCGKRFGEGAAEGCQECQNEAKLRERLLCLGIFNKKHRNFRISILAMSPLYMYSCFCYNFRRESAPTTSASMTSPNDTEYWRSRSLFPPGTSMLCYGICKSIEFW